MAERKISMPIYEYQCSQCGAEFEKLVRRQNETVLCPQCQCPELTRLPSLFGFSSGGEFTSSAPSEDSCGSCSHTHCSTCGK